jgi:hypothetical protein
MDYRFPVRTICTFAYILDREYKVWYYIRSSTHTKRPTGQERKQTDDILPEDREKAGRVLRG